jgi:hypothetical protein
MQRTTFALALAGAAGVLLAAPASAVTCYQLLDRNDTIVYRDIYPPVDLSDEGAAQRQVLRARGEHLISMEVDKCPTLVFLTGGAGGTRLDFTQMPDLTSLSPEQALAGAGVAPPKRGAAATGAGAKSTAPAKPAGSGSTSER